MKVIQAPNKFPKRPRLFHYPPALFVAGGITGTVDWQQPFINSLVNTNLLILNPRRDDFDANDPFMSDKQIEWEFVAMRRADAISFWFPEETLCPITLYELGAWAMTKIPLFVGCHPGYKRKFDVVKQLSLIKPKVAVVYSPEDLTKQVLAWSEKWNWKKNL